MGVGVAATARFQVRFGMHEVYCPSCSAHGVIRRKLDDEEPCWSCGAPLVKRKPDTPNMVNGIPALLASFLSLRAVLFILVYMGLNSVPFFLAQLAATLLLVVGAQRFCLRAMAMKDGRIDFPTIGYFDLMNLKTVFAMGFYSIGLVGAPLVIGLATVLLQFLPSGIDLPTAGSAGTLAGIAALLVFLWAPIGLLTYLRTHNLFALVHPVWGVQTILADPVFIWLYWAVMMVVNVALVVTSFLSNVLFVVGIFFAAGKALMTLTAFGWSGLYIRQNARKFDLPCDTDDWEPIRPPIEVDLGALRNTRRRRPIEAIELDEPDATPRQSPRVASNWLQDTATATADAPAAPNAWWETDAAAPDALATSPHQDEDAAHLDAGRMLGVADFEQKGIDPELFDVAGLPENAPLRRADAQREAGEEGWLSEPEEELMNMYFGEGAQDWRKVLDEPAGISDDTAPVAGEAAPQVPLAAEAGPTLQSRPVEAPFPSVSGEGPALGAAAAEPSAALPAAVPAPVAEPTSSTDAAAPLGRLGRYALQQKVAIGGMAEIFLATQEGAGGFKKKVIVKRMLKELESNQEAVGMFLDEAGLASHISHPNVVHILDFGQQDDHYFMALEHLTGMDVEQYLGRITTPMPIPVAVSIVVQACEGLHAAHEATDDDGKPLNITHRDVSPSNLFITKDGMVKVLDFGIAQAVERRSKTKTGIVKGKPLYMSPEQVTGKVVDRRSDVFALATTLYELLAGENPFVRDTEYSTLYAIATEKVASLHTVRDGVPEALAEAVGQAMRRNRDNRLQTADAFRTALLPFLDGRTPRDVLREHYRNATPGAPATGDGPVLKTEGAS